MCLVAPSLDMVGGQAVQASRLLERLNLAPSLRVELLPVNPRAPGPLRALQRVKYARTLITSVLYVASLFRRLPRCDVVHVFSASYLSFVLAPLPAMLVAKLYRKRIVLNYRSGEAEDHLWRWRRTAVPAMRLAEEIIVPSGYLVDVFRRFGLGARAICNFVDGDKYRYRERSPIRPVFLSNRHFEPLYNVECVLRAFALIQREVPAARLILAGDGSQRQHLASVTESLGLRNVELRGRVAPSDMPSLYDEADIYLNAPDIDNMPSSVIEAFTAGLPVVSTDAGGIPYIVTHEGTGLLCARDDDSALAANALRLLREPALAQAIILRARAEALARYTWRVVGPQWETLYTSMAGRRSSAEPLASPS